MYSDGSTRYFSGIFLDYNDYQDLVPSSLEEESSITPGTANRASRPQDCGGADSAPSIEFDALVIDDIGNPLQGTLNSTSSAFQAFGSDDGSDDFAEFDFSSLAKLTGSHKFATVSPGSIRQLNSVPSIPLTEERAKVDMLERNSRPLKTPDEKSSVESPGLPLAQPGSAATRPLKVASEAKVPPQLGKPIDRSSLIQAYQKKINSGKEKDIINLLVVGHVDAGKSTLMGNVLCQLGHVSEKQLAKYQWEAQKIGKASFAYAWVLDQTSEERSRGITMDIAQMAFETHSKRVVLLDAPGHRDFVPQVIGGAAQADVALLVVNATSGEFETGMELAGGQTQEHARLVRLLGVSRLIVAVNKMDTVSWSQSRYEEIRIVMMRMLKTINQTDAVFCPVSGLYGINLLHSTDTPPEKDIQHLAPWYSGPCLLDIIDSLDKVERPVDAPFRFVVSDVFKPVGSSVPVVAGRVVSGAVSAGVNLATSKIICLPSGRMGSVRSIRSLAAVPSGGGGATSALDIILPYAFAGDQVGLMLSGLDPDLALTPGDVISDPDPPLPSITTSLRAKVLVFDVHQPITKGYPVIFYYHCSSVPAVITKLLSATVKDKDSGKKAIVKPRCLFGRCTAEIELTLESPVCMEIYDVCKPLGRFVLRVAGESIAGGTVTATWNESIG
ncbi:unnamed protein product [Hydatigera taeniaeformis]|uniref:Tr-type G domain-containing protein n=1 Tax=Hydatigena taeniaeformis TaxID=6205 RepID=A0A3P7FNZ1_HYDTA|nr:unnamed protein product [Hydatigera taeniaeformis]